MFQLEQVDWDGLSLQLPPDCNVAVGEDDVWAFDLGMAGFPELYLGMFGMDAGEVEGELSFQEQVEQVMASFGAHCLATARDEGHEVNDEMDMQTETTVVSENEIHLFGTLDLGENIWPARIYANQEQQIFILFHACCAKSQYDIVIKRIMDSLKIEWDAFAGEDE